MSDIAKRLREAIHAWGTDGLTPVFSEAADRLEELERRLNLLEAQVRVLERYGRGDDGSRIATAIRKLMEKE